jgi:integrase
VPVPAFLRDDLAVQLAGSHLEDFVFPGVRGGVLRNKTFRRSHFDPAAASIGVEGLVPHELRHTAASLAIAAGASVKGVQAMLGHASATLTLDSYGHLFGDELDGVAQRLDDAVRGQLADISRTSRATDVVALSERAG